jgi:hypothetical protein
MGLTCDWEPSKAPFLLQCLYLSNGSITANDNRVHDEAVLEPLNLLNHLCLSICRTVVVDNTKAALKRHVDGHLMLRNGIHGGGNEWSPQGDALRDWRIQVDVRRSEANVAGQNEKIVIG